MPGKGDGCAPMAQGEKTHYADVVLDPSRIADIVEASEVPGAKDTQPGGKWLPEDMGPAPDQVAPGVGVAEAAFGTGGMLLPEMAPDSSRWCGNC